MAAFLNFLFVIRFAPFVLHTKDTINCIYTEVKQSNKLCL